MTVLENDVTKRGTAVTGLTAYTKYYLQVMMTMIIMMMNDDDDIITLLTPQAENGPTDRKRTCMKPSVSESRDFDSHVSGKPQACRVT